MRADVAMLRKNSKIHRDSQWQNSPKMLENARIQKVNFSPNNLFLVEKKTKQATLWQIFPTQSPTVPHCPSLSHTVPPCPILSHLQVSPRDTEFPHFS